MNVLRPNGTARVRLIAPGHGSSGYYSETLLQKSAPRFTDAFMYWDHATAQEDAARPEGSLNRLAGKIQGTPTYEAANPAGPGLYADVKVYEPYRKAVESMGTDIGISIRALGKSRMGTAPDGKKANLIEDIVVARSADWVTAPGANGRALELFESARSGPSTPAEEASDMDEAQVQRLIAEARQEDQTTIATLTQQMARLQETSLLREAQDLATAEVQRSTLPDLTKARVIRETVAHVPLKEGAIDREAFGPQLTEAIRQAAAEVSQALGGGMVRGMGSSVVAEELTEAQARTRLEESFRLAGMSESSAKLAASGGR